MTMAVKFKIGFQIDAETLFGIMAKFLPLENLSVEEVIERPERPSAPKLLKGAPIPKNSPKIKRRRATNATGGQIKALADYARAHGPSSYGDFANALQAAGFSRAGVGSALKRAVTHGVLQRHEDGGYGLAKTA